MDSLLHSMRTQARRLGVVVVSLFVLSSLQVIFPTAAAASEAQPMPSLEAHAAHHHHDHQAPPAQQHDHATGGACCLTGHHCNSATCTLSLLPAEHATLPLAAGIIPSAQLTLAAVSRPLSPPRRPPKG